MLVHPEVKQLIDSLQDVSNWKQQQETLESWMKDDRVGLLLETARGLEDLGGKDAPSAFRAIRQNSIRALALMPGEASAVAAREFARDGNERRLASWMASAQSIDVIGSLVESGGPEDVEFLACLVQEAVTRHGRLESEPITAFWSALAGSGHPLSWLPLALSDAESNLSLRHYALFGESFGLPFGPEYREEEDIPESTDVIAPTVTLGTRCAIDTEGVFAAVRDWRDASNGKLECKAYQLDPTAVSSLAESLLALDLECLAGAPSVLVKERPPEEAFGILFAAASSGGAYNSGAQAAYGRLLAWQSAAALGGAESGVGFEDVKRSFVQATWYSFSSLSDWFYQVAWDIGLIAIRPDHGSVAILAATDTD